MLPIVETSCSRWIFTLRIHPNAVALIMCFWLNMTWSKQSITISIYPIKASPTASASGLMRTVFALIGVSFKDSLCVYNTSLPRSKSFRSHPFFFFFFFETPILPGIYLQAGERWFQCFCHVVLIRYSYLVLTRSSRSFKSHEFIGKRHDKDQFMVWWIDIGQWKWKLIQFD